MDNVSFMKRCPSFFIYFNFAKEELNMPKLVKKMSRDFTIINNKLLRDGNLGSSERGLLVTMLSLPDGWSFSIRGLAQILPDGITKISNTLNKLESLNYLSQQGQYLP